RFFCDGVVKLVAARFFAWGVLPLLAGPADGVKELATVLGPEWHDAADRIEAAVAADDDDAAVAALQDLLIGKLLAATVDRQTIPSAAEMLHLTKGQFRITELAEHCNVSSRQLERQFQASIGVSPKALARAIRFEEIRRRLMLDPAESLTALAHEFGYTDQAHF